MARLPEYLSVLTTLGRSGTTTVSSSELAEASGVTSAQLRKDLSFLGAHGVRGVGYDVGRLTVDIGRRLGLTRTWPVVIVGMGRLGQAVAAHRGLAERGLHVAAVLDQDPELIGRTVGGHVVVHIDELAAVTAGLGPFIGVVATPSGVAQQVCDELVRAGARSILTFAPGLLTVSPPVRVRKVDVATELQILAFHAQPPVPESGTGPETAPDATPGPTPPVAPGDLPNDATLESAHEPSQDRVDPRDSVRAGR